MLHRGQVRLMTRGPDALPAVDPLLLLLLVCEPAYEQRYRVEAHGTEGKCSKAAHGVSYCTSCRFHSVKHGGVGLWDFKLIGMWNLPRGMKLHCGMRVL